MLVSGLQAEIFETLYCLIVHWSFLTSRNPLPFSLCKTSKNVFGFSVVFSQKSVQISSLNISRTAWRILVILVSFCRILNGLWKEINLCRRCNSPLSNWRTVMCFPQLSFAPRPKTVFRQPFLSIGDGAWKGCYPYPGDSRSWESPEKADNVWRLFIQILLR